MTDKRGEGGQRTCIGCGQELSCPANGCDTCLGWRCQRCCAEGGEEAKRLAEDWEWEEWWEKGR